MSDSFDVVVATTEFSPFRGGLASYSESIAAGLGAAGHMVQVLAPAYSRTIGGDSAVEHIVKRFLFLPRRAPLRRRWSLARAVMNATGGSKDVVVLATTYLSAQVCALVLAVQPRRFRLVTTVCGPELIGYPIWSPREWWRRVIWALLKRSSHRVICISEFSRRLALEAGIRDEKLRVIYVGVDVDYFKPAPDADAWRQKTLGHSKGPLVLTTGRLDRRKGHDIALEAIDLLRKKYPELLYVIVGNGEEEQRLRAIVRRLGLDPHVMFAGRVSRDDLRRAYSAADVFLLPTRQEGNWVEAQGLVVIEAGLCGAPAVVGRHGGVLEIVTHERTGLLVDPRSPKEAAEAIDRLLTNPSLKKQLVATAREEWSSRFSVAAMVRSTETVIWDE
jgi:phosphatidyl-myo-inositol dimannoside synthase